MRDNRDYVKVLILSSSHIRNIPLLQGGGSSQRVQINVSSVLVDAKSALPQSNMASQHPPLVRRILPILQPWVPCTVESWCYLTLRSCKISNMNKGSSIAVNAFRVIRGPCDSNDFAPLMAPNLPPTSPGLRQQ